MKTIKLIKHFMKFDTILLTLLILLSKKKYMKKCFEISQFFALVNWCADGCRTGCYKVICFVAWYLTVQAPCSTKLKNVTYKNLIAILILNQLWLFFNENIVDIMVYLENAL